MVQPPSPWHSTVPYLFGGLATMLVLIVLSLLLLACSYRRVSGRLDGGADENEGGSNKQVKVCEDKILVIMAGEVNPTFLGTPVFTKPSTFVELKDKEGAEKMEESSSRITENHERQHQSQDQN